MFPPSHMRPRKRYSLLLTPVQIYLLQRTPTQLRKEHQLADMSSTFSASCCRLFEWQLSAPSTSL
jgi:hypothetical protein